jgi:hypothetical protein
MRFLLFCLISAIAIPAQAEMTRIQPASGITDVALDAAVELRTFTVAKLRGRWQRLTIGVAYVKGGGGDATALIVTCTGSMDAGATFKKITSTAVATGIGTVSPYSDLYPLAGGDEGFLVSYDIVNLDQLKCILAGTGTIATHEITAQLSLSVVQ